MKKLKAFILVLILCMLAVGCSGSKNEEKKEEEKKDPEPETVERVNVPDEYLGEYHEQTAGRASLTLEPSLITIYWSNSASECSYFEFIVNYDEANSRIDYENGIRKEFTYTSDTEHTETETYNDGSGFFAIADGNLLWYDDKSESSDPVVFVRDDAAAADPNGNTPNPWTYTENLDEALKIAGVEFQAPIQESLPEGYTFREFAAAPGTVRAYYETEDTVLLISKSNVAAGLELSGDYNEYPDHWTDSLKGLAIDCYGYKNKANLTYFSTDTYNYAVSVFPKDMETFDGIGLDVDQLQSLTMGMQ